MSNNRQATLYYFHDPMCSWCWGFRPTWLKLQEHLPQNIKVEYVLGGLAADNDQPMPQDMREMLQGTWRQIHRELGADFILISGLKIRRGGLPTHLVGQ
ncbi:MAG: DsbA family protein [Pseudomonadales bacterium]|nr:DsbA family protein [Pseudomonadales bacterium]